VGEKFQEIVGGADHGPLGTHFLDAAQQKLAEAACLFDLSEHRLHHLLSQSVRRFEAAVVDLFAHQLREAVSNLKTLIKACMDHKFGITTGGHNIMIDVIENDVSAGCLTLGSNLIKDETTRFTKALTQGGFVP
jgi:hypothetical protein